MPFVFLCHSQASVVLYHRALGSGADDGRGKRGLWGSRIGQHFHPRGGGLGDNGLDSWEVAVKPLTVTNTRKEKGGKETIHSLCKDRPWGFLLEELWGTDLSVQSASLVVGTKMRLYFLRTCSNDHVICFGYWGPNWLLGSFLPGMFGWDRIHDRKAESVVLGSGMSLAMSSELV